MPRVVDRSQGSNPELEAAIAGGAARSRRNIRESSPREKRQARKRRDKFFIPKEMIPQGYSVEWKRESCLGKPEEADYFMDLGDAGWKYATPTQFPKLVPEGYEGNTIKRGGLVLMIRPSHMKEESLQLDREEAREQVRDKLTEIGMTGAGELGRKVFNFDRGYERPASRNVPDDDGSDPMDYEPGEPDADGN